MNAIFLGLLLLSIIFVFVSNKNNKFIYSAIAILLISFLAGFRGNSVGIDTGAYIDALVRNFPKSWQFAETGYRIISVFLMKIVGNPSVVLFVYALITNFLIVRRLWEIRKKCNYPFMYLLYILIFYLNTLNIMRQFIVIAVLFYFSKLLQEKKYILYTIIIVLCSFVHRSALLAILLVFIFLWNDFSKNKKIVFSLPILIISIFTVVYIGKLESATVLHYFSSNQAIQNLNITFFYKVFAFIASYILFLTNKKIVVRKSNSEQEFVDLKKDKQFKIVSELSFFGLIFSSMGMFFFIMSRFGLYYQIFELEYWGYLTQKNKNKFFNASLILIYGIYVFAIEIIKNGSGIFPYYFNF